MAYLDIGGTRVPNLPKAIAAAKKTYQAQVAAAKKKALQQAAPKKKQPVKRPAAASAGCPLFICVAGNSSPRDGNGSATTPGWILGNLGINGTGRTTTSSTCVIIYTVCPGIAISGLGSSSRASSGGIALPAPYPRGGGVDIGGNLGRIAAAVAAASAVGLARKLAEEATSRSEGCFGSSGEASAIYLNLDYGGGATRGRASGVEACLVPGVERDTSSMPAVPGITPGSGLDRAHLLAWRFGGKNSRENLVPLYHNANQGHAADQMVGIENQIAKTLVKQKVYYSSIPIYSGSGNPYIP